MLTFAQVFRDCLKEGESPEAASLRLGISERTARFYANGISIPTTTRYQSMAERMGVNLATLVAICDADRARRRRVRTPKHGHVKPAMKRGRDVSGMGNKLQQVSKRKRDGSHAVQALHEIAHNPSETFGSL